MGGSGRETVPGQSLCIWRQQPDRRHRLLRIYPADLCGLWSQPRQDGHSPGIGGSGNPSLPGSGGRPGCLLWTCGYLQWKRRPDTCVVAVGGDHRVSELHVSSDTLREESPLILGGQTEGLRFVAQALFSPFIRRSSGHASSPYIAFCVFIQYNGGVF